MFKVNVELKWIKKDVSHSATKNFAPYAVFSVNVQHVLKVEYI